MQRAFAINACTVHNYIYGHESKFIDCAYTCGADRLAPFFHSPLFRRFLSLYPAILPFFLIHLDSLYISFLLFFEINEDKTEDTC